MDDVQAEAGAGPEFPIRIDADHRYLLDASGRPFLMQGEAAWSLIAELDRDEVDAYLADRKERGFNTLLVNLLEHRFSSQPPNNIYGTPPFEVPGDFATPNEEYFQHADWVLERAAEEGFLVLLTPAYTGWIGGSDGWWEELKTSGVETLREYGRYVGLRYTGMQNIIWTQGGDGDPPDKELIDAIADGIHDADPDALQTVHTNRDTPPLEYWSGRDWLAINNFYTYDDVYSSAVQEYLRSSLPFFLMEAIYENEQDITTTQVRTQIYHAILAGATGHIFGNNPIWHFSSNGLYESDQSWQEALDSPGTRSVTIAGEFFNSIPWWELSPDITGELILDGVGEGDERGVAAVACDQSFGVVYIPTDRPLMLDLACFTASELRLSWRDPTAPTAPIVESWSLSNDSQYDLDPPGPNSASESDWLLTIEPDVPE